MKTVVVPDYVRVPEWKQRKKINFQTFSKRFPAVRNMIFLANVLWLTGGLPHCWASVTGPSYLFTGPERFINHHVLITKLEATHTSTSMVKCFKLAATYTTFPGCTSTLSYYLYTIKGAEKLPEKSKKALKAPVYKYKKKSKNLINYKL